MPDENWRDRETKDTLGFRVEIAIAGGFVALGFGGTVYWLWKSLVG